LIGNLGVTALFVGKNDEIARRYGLLRLDKSKDAERQQKQQQDNDDDGKVSLDSRHGSASRPSEKCAKPRRPTPITPFREKRRD
jgi:hypothetical protein